MLVEHLKRGDTFKNTNGNLCLVYNVTSNKCFIVNYVGNYYHLKRNNNGYDYNATELNRVKPCSFIENYPKISLFPEKEYVWKAIVKEFEDSEKCEEEILLIIK